MSAFRPVRVFPGFGMNGLIQVGANVPPMTFMDPFDNTEKKVAAPMRLSVNSLKKDEKELEDIVYDNMKPVVMLIRAMGVLPIVRPQIGSQLFVFRTDIYHSYSKISIQLPGITKFKLASNQMIYSILLYVALSTHTFYVVWNRVKIVQSVQGRFEEAVIAYLFVFYLLPHFLIPVLWYEAKKCADCFNHWMDFQARLMNPHIESFQKL